ncbi:MAG: ABC transporter ATP-binding protein [Solirubrobacterales bacterium]
MSPGHPEAKMSVDEKLKIQDAGPAAPGPDTPAVIRVKDLHKSFRIPTQRVDSFKERAVHPFTPREFRELRALDGISFEIRRGEFFGIVGRNGSGKSTLLKLLASIYKADSGTIEMAGRLAPFIELGVGFNQELTARENAILNGVMMGLTPQESRDRLDGVIEFAELGDFVDLKLKNYSSGMLVRLAFSLMLEVDADILLIDEVLAVGDAAFQQKCADAFHEMKKAGKTIILVTHEMSSVEEYCHRAMLINDGKIEYLGTPDEVGRRYLKLNFERGSEGGSSAVETGGDDVRIVEAQVEDAEGEKISALEQGEPIRFRVEVEVLRDLPGIFSGFIVTNADGLAVTKIHAPLDENEEREMTAGQRATFRVKLDNPLGPGRYFINCGINRSFGGGVALYVHNALDFVIYGSTNERGMVAIPFEAGGSVERDGR